MATAALPAHAGLLPCDEILRIARRDAEAVYPDLSGYRISMVCDKAGWHVDYDLTKLLVAGGGPHYVIDPVTGVILDKWYEQ